MIKDVSVYIWVLVLVAAAVLTAIGIFRWLADQNDRRHRLNIVSGCAFCILVLMFLSAGWGTISAVLGQCFGDSAKATGSLIFTSKITIKVLLMVLIVAFAVLLTLTAALFVIYGLWAMIHTICSFDKNGTESLEKVLKEKADKLVVMLRNPVFIVIITGGVLAIFGILPVVMGNDPEGKGHLAECWRLGVQEIASFWYYEEDEFTQSLCIYVLIYISVLGIGYAVANIIFEILKELLNRKNRKNFLSEYSNSIVLLAVGVSVLLMFSSGDIKKDTSWVGWLANFSKSFGLVLFVIALGVLTLEITRLLMDMKETLIRKEARYLFVMLVGYCAVISVKTLSLIYNALSSALAGNETSSGCEEESMENVQGQVVQKIEQEIKEEINGPLRNPHGADITFSAFKKRVTRK